VAGSPVAVVPVAVAATWPSQNRKTQTAGRGSPRGALRNDFYVRIEDWGFQMGCVLMTRGKVYLSGWLHWQRSRIGK
jgi:hypothetical protein